MAVGKSTDGSTRVATTPPPVDAKTVDTKTVDTNAVATPATTPLTGNGAAQPWQAAGAGKTFSGSGSGSLGPVSGSGSATGTLVGSDIQQAQIKFTALAALRHLANTGQLTFSTDGNIQIKDNKLDSANVNALLSIVAGKNVTLNAKGQLTDTAGKLDASLSASMSAVWKQTKIDTSDNLVLKDSAVSGSVDASITQLLGANGSATASIKAELAKGGIVAGTISASSFTRLKQLGADGSISLNTDGSLDLKNNKVDGGQVGALLTVVANKAVSLTAGGQIADSDGKVDTTFTSTFKGAWDNTTVAANGTLALSPDGVTGNASAQVTQLLGKHTTGTLQASYDASSKGQMKISALAELKTLQKNGSIDVKADGTVTVKDGKVSTEVDGLLSLVAGKSVTLNAQGKVTTADGKVDATFSNNFKGTWGSTQLSTDGTLQLTNGALSGTADASLNATLGKAGTLALKGSVAADKTGITAANIQASALTRLKQLGADGSIDLKTDGSIDIKNNKVDKAELGALLTIVSGKKLNVTAQGQITDTAGKVDATFSSTFKGTWANTQLAADGSLALKDGKLTGSGEATLTQTLGAGTVGTLKVSAAKTDTGALKLAAMTELKQLSKTGSLDVEADGTMTITDGKVSAAQVNSLLSLVAGKSVVLNAKGQVTDTAGKIDATFSGNFKGTWDNTQLTASGNLALKNGALTGQAQVQATQLFGKNASATLNATVDGTGIVSANIQEASLERLKQLGADGSITLKTDGSVDIKNNKIDKAEVDALLTVIAGKAMTVTAGGQVVDTNGKIDANFSGSLKAAWDNTTLTADGKLALTDGKLTASGEAQLTQVIGKAGTASLQATFDQDATGDLKLGALATLKLAGKDGSVNITNNGTVTVKNGKIDSAELNALVSATLGKQVTVNATGQVVDAQGKVSATLSGQLQAAWDNTTINSKGNLALKDGKLTGQDQLTVTQLFGKNASAKLDATVNNDGIAAATLQASAFKQLKKLGDNGSFSMQSDGSVTVTDNKVTNAQINELLSLVNGKGVKLDAGAKIVDANGAIQTTFTNDLAATWGNTTLDADSTLSLKNGAITGTVEGSITNMLGKDVTSSLKASYTKDGPVDSEIKVAAFKQLKKLGDNGAIGINADGTVDIKDGKIDRAEVSSLLSVIAGQEVNLTTGGQLVYANGKVDTTFQTNLKAAWDNTTVNGNVTVNDGKVTGQISALFGPAAKVQGGVNLAVTGVDSGRLDVKLQGMGKATKIDGTGSLVLDHGKIAAASLTTNLISTGTDKNNMSLNGVVTVGSDAAAAKLKAQMTAGDLTGALGVGVSSAVAIYTPGADDPTRQAIAARGGVFASQKVTFDASANLAFGATVNVDGVQVGLGLKTDAEKKTEIDLLTVHPNAADAKAISPLTVIHVPKHVADLDKMLKVGEQISTSGTRTVGVGGDVSVGVGAGPVGAKLTGSAYYQITADMRQDVARDDVNKYTVRYSLNGGKVDVKTVAASLGLDSGKLLAGVHGPVGDIAKNAAPMIDQLAKIGISLKMEKSSKGTTVFVAHYDTTNPAARAALEHALNDEEDATKQAGQDPKSGVVIDKLQGTNINAKTRDGVINLSVLSWEDVSRQLEAKQDTWTTGDFTSVEAVDNLVEKKTPNSDSSFDTRVLRQVKVTNRVALPGTGDTVTTDGQLTVHVPTAAEKPQATLADAEAMLSASMTLGHSKTGPTDAIKYFDQMIASMKASGYKPSEYAAIQSLRDSVANGEGPSRDPFFHLGPIKLGDKRYEDLQVKVEGFVGPKGVGGIFAGKTEPELVNAYLDLDRPGIPPLVSSAGTRDAIARTIGGQLVPSKTAGSWDVVRKNAADPTKTDVLGTLTDADISDLRDSIVGLAKRDPTDPNFKASLSGARGKWNGAVPEPLITVTAQDWGNSTDLVNRARNFGKYGAQIGALVTANTPPLKNAGETSAAYEARLETWQDTSLWKKPDEYWDQVSDLYSKGMQNDKTGDAAFTSIKLAGPNFVYGKSWVTMGATELKAIIDAGRANVQKFGAVDVLATLGAKVDAGGNIVLPPLPQKKLDQATAAMKVLFGPATVPQGAAKPTNTDGPGPVTYSGLKWPTPGFKEGLTGFLAATPGAKADGSLQLNGLTAAQQAKFLPEVFGNTVVVENGELKFDNRDGRYNLIHFGDALSPFGGAFGVYRMGETPPLFPSAANIDDRGTAQSYSAQGLVVRHDGVDSHWEFAFNGLENLSHADGTPVDINADPAVSTNPNAWVLVSR